MVYRIGVEEMAHTRETTVFHPLPEESEFVVEARESLQEDSRARVTTAQLRGNLRGRGRCRLPSTNAARGRGRGSGSVPKIKKQDMLVSTLAKPARGRCSGTKKKKQQLEEEVAEISHQREEGDYNTEEGSAYHLLFGDEQEEARARQSSLPDLNEVFPDQDEVELTQTTPSMSLISCYVICYL
jgi:hypothetical protein